MTNALKVRDEGFAIKASDVKDDGAVSGYASMFGVKDSYGEIVVMNAFDRTIKEWAASGRKLPMLNQHNSREPLGVWDTMKEDKKGLFVEGRVNLDTQIGREQLSHMKMGALTGLSIGYQVRDDSFDEEKRVRYLKDLKLMEISPVTFPACEPARINPIKGLLAAGDVPSVRVFEGSLRDLGFSKQDALLIAARGYSEWLRRRDSGEVAEAEVIKAMRSLTATLPLRFEI